MISSRDLSFASSGCGRRAGVRTQCGFGLFRLRKNHGLRRFQECITEISHRMPRHTTAPPASRRLRRLRFDRRCAKGHRKFAAAWVKDRVLTVTLNPGSRSTPFAVRFVLPCSHLPHLITTIILYRCGRRTGKSIRSTLTATVVVVSSRAGREPVPRGFPRTGMHLIPMAAPQWQRRTP